LARAESLILARQWATGTAALSTEDLENWVKEQGHEKVDAALLAVGGADNGDAGKPRLQRRRLGMPTAAQKAAAVSSAKECAAASRKRSLIERLRADLADVEKLANWPELNAPQQKRLDKAVAKMRSALTELIDIAKSA